MTYLLKHTKKNYGKNVAKILIVTISIVIFAALLNIFGFRSALSNLFSPFMKVGNNFYGSVNETPKNFSSKEELISENEKLANEIENSRLAAVDYEAIKSENQKLRDQLGIKPEGDFITASIMAKSPQIPTDSLLVDGGLSDGVKEGDLVFASEKTIIGRIVKTTKSKSTVALNSFADVVSYGVVERTGEPLEIKGHGGGFIETKVPIDFDIVLGDKIMSNGIPQNVIAIVGVVEEDESSGFKNIMMSLPANVSKISAVFIKPSPTE